ncbi:MAG: D-aminoacyl-tRNA deacylase, partial [Nitrospinota bacterium]|nr:D-aminoacyl-tRNA deacylase [Nitrospinota bacterium]
MKRLEGRVALVTGGSRGLGRGIALAFAGEGAKIAFNYLQAEDAAREVVGEIGGGILALMAVAPGDSEREVRYMADKISNLRIFPDEAGKM